eukprot:6467657-Amphidinium_carterae.3
MPNSSKSSIDRTAGSLISLVRALFKVLQSLRAKTGFQARKVPSLLSNLNKQSFGRVPLDLKINFMPSKKLAFTLPG